MQDANVQPVVSKMDHKYLKETLFYHRKTGQFKWRVKRSGVRIGDFAGCIRKDKYVLIRIDNKLHLAHRLAWFYVYGKWPKKNLDHIDGNPANNRIENLREVNPSENQKNMKLNSSSKTGIMGVIWNKQANKWAASITIKYKTIHIGYSNDFFEACCLRKSAENLCGFHQNHGRFCI
jgi:hypothetical protein